MLYASIDIGTNTLRLLIAQTSASGAIRPLIYKRIITRLGGGYTTQRGIDASSAERSFAALVEFKKIIIEHGAESVHAVATSVVRRACNRDWFLGEVRQKTGIEVSVISGDEEARLSLLGVLSVLGNGRGRDLIIDIGGGSTEFIFIEAGRMTGAWSMEMGVVHLTEEHLKSDPPSATEIGGMEAGITGVIAGLKNGLQSSGIDPAEYSSKAGAVFVGTAGTITTLAALEMNLEVYDRDRINKHRLTKDAIQGIYRRLLSLTMAERARIPSLEAGREDLIIPGAYITLKTMEIFGFDEIVVSDAGLLEGIIIDRSGADAFQKNGGCR